MKEAKKNAKSIFINQRRNKFKKLDDSPNYKNVRFNELTGAIQAVHIDHHFDAAKGHYEEEVINILYKNGNKVILESEKNIEGVKTPDGTLNDSVFEIKSVEGTGTNNIKNKFNEARSQGCSHIIFYFPDSSIYSHQRIKDGYKRYAGVNRKEKLNDPLENIWILVNQIIIVFK